MPKSALRAAITPPGEVGDGVPVEQMSDEFGAAIVRREEYALTELGMLFKACNPTMGTGIAAGIQTTFSDTANVLALMRNGSTTKKIVPLYIRLINTAAGATTTSAHLAIILDVANRYSTGGTDLLASVVNANSGQAPTSAVDVLRFGAVTALAQSAKRQVARAVLKTQATPCWNVGDEVLITFGSVPNAGAIGALSGAAAARYFIPVAPVVLQGQNHCMLVHQWNVANATTAPSWETEMAWFEK